MLYHHLLSHPFLTKHVHVHPPASINSTAASSLMFLRIERNHRCSLFSNMFFLCLRNMANAKSLVFPMPWMFLEMLLVKTSNGWKCNYNQQQAQGKLNTSRSKWWFMLDSAPTTLYDSMTLKLYDSIDTILLLYRYDSTTLQLSTTIQRLLLLLLLRLLLVLLLLLLFSTFSLSVSRSLDY